MSDLNLSISEEEQVTVEEKIAKIMGREIVNSYGSISSQLLSSILTAQQKPQALEELFAVTEVYGNIVKKLFGVDNDMINVEKVKAYKNLQEIIVKVEEQIAAQEAEKKAQEEANTTVVEDVAVEEASDDSDDWHISTKE